jgi:hypothetical protein
MKDTAELMQSLAALEEREREFGQILAKIEYTSNESKVLWQEIYRNAIEDRTNAHLLFVDLYRFVFNDHEKHQIHAKHLSAYLERMNKATDQLLKLAELVDSARREDEKIDAEALYSQLESH